MGVAQAIDGGQPVICRVCGHSNLEGAVHCSGCWLRLDRVAAAPGEEVVSAEEREESKEKASKKRSFILRLVALAVSLILAVQFLNITFPLFTPSSTISSVSASGEWAMIYRNFEGPGPVPGESDDIAGRVKWTFETSEQIVSTPAVKGGRVYLTTQDNRVVALDAFTGTLIWEHATVAPVDSSPAVAGDLVFFGVRDRRVIALDADTGELRWEFVTENNPTTGSPIVKDGVVYIGSGDGNIYALDALTGKKLWSHLSRDWITNTPALSDDLLVVSSFDGRVTVYDTDTGKMRFSFRGFNRLIMGSPVIVEDSIYVPYRDGLVTSVNLREKEVLFATRWYRFRLQLWLWDMAAHPGLPKGVNWVTLLGSTINKTSTADADKVYVPTEDGRLHAIDRFTGERLCIFDSETDNLSTPTLVENIVLVGDSKGKLRAVDKESGEEQWALQIAEGLTSTPVLAGGTLYLASKDGTLYAVE